MSDDEYVFDEDSGEWIPASEAKAKAARANAVEVRDSVGNLLADGDAVVLIKDLKVKGANVTLKRGEVIRSIRLTGDPQEVDCRHDAVKGLVLRAEFLRKR
jgi:protein PhnA